MEAVTAVLDPGSDSGQLMDLNMPKLPSAIPGQFVTLILLWNGGGSLRWFCDNFAQKDKEEARAKGADVYAEILGASPGRAASSSCPICPAVARRG